MAFQRLLLLSLITLFVLSCDRDSDQEQFEREAFAQPNNFTQTNANAEIIRLDPDDWRIGPMFQGLVEMNAPAYPNPSSGTRFTVELLVTGLESVFGLEIYTRDDFGRPYLIYTDNRRPLPPGIVDIYLEPVWFSPNRLYSTAIGLRRVFIYDGNGNLITYGDLKIE
jgi:hypothetical protein